MAAQTAPPPRAGDALPQHDARVLALAAILLVTIAILLIAVIALEQSSQGAAPRADRRRRLRQPVRRRSPARSPAISRCR